MANELKPCPFCGGQNIAIVWNNNRTWLECVECDARTKSFYSPIVIENRADSQDQAAAAWNTRPAAPVEGLETVGYVRLDRSKLIHPRTLENHSGQDMEPVVTRSQAEAIIAAKVEQERLRFEGDLDKWMNIIGAGITGYQPEAYALMDLACQELVKLRADNAELNAEIGRWGRDHGKLSDKAQDIEADNAALTARVKELEHSELVKGVNTQYANALAYLEMTEDDDPEEFAKRLWDEREALENQLAAAEEREKNAFKAGYVLACCNVVHQHDEPTIAHDALAELGVSKAEVKAMKLSEFDMKALRTIERDRASSPYAKPKPKDRAVLEDKP